MKFVKKMHEKARKALMAAGGVALSASVLANDKLASVVDGELQDIFGGGSSVWKIFILVDIILSTAFAVKTKNPMTFLGVFTIILVPGFLIKTFVFY